MTTVDEMIEKLLKLPGHWEVQASRRAALRVTDPDGGTFGYVHPDERETTLLSSRQSSRGKPCPVCGVKAGQSCRSLTSGRVTEPHSARREKG